MKSPFAKTVLAHTVCATHDWSFDTVFRHQYRISPITEQLPPLSPNWPQVALDDWRIEHCPALRVTRLLSGSDKMIGLVLGVAITRDGDWLGESFDCTALSGADMAQWIEGLAGRYVVLIQAEGTVRFYSDPTGSLSAVYDPAIRVIGTSVPLVVHGPLQEWPDVTREAVLTRKHLFLFGETSDVRVIRALPNHYLSMDDFSLHRHWPGADVAFASLDEQRLAAVSEISARLTQIISALVANFSCALPVTGGADSRLLLATSRPVRNKIDHFYCWGSNYSTDNDVKLAMLLAEHLAIPIQVFSRHAPSVSQRLRDNHRDDATDLLAAGTGWCFLPRPDWAAYANISPRCDIVMRGVGIELVRAIKWKRDTFGVPCSAQRGLTILSGMRPNAQRNAAEEARYQTLLARYADWMASLPPAAQTRVYDLAHVELWMPSASNIQFSGFTRDFGVNPYNDRRIVQLSAGMSPRARNLGKIIERMIAQHEPGLNAFDYRISFQKAFDKSKNNGLRK